MILQFVFFLAHGNRSEILVQLCFIIIYLFGKFKIFLTEVRISVIQLLAIFFSILLFYVVGEIRDGSFDGIFIIDRGYLYLSTLSGSMWSQIALTSTYSSMGTLFGSTYLDHFANITPSFIPVPWERAPEAASFLIDGETIGGMGFWGEAFLNFGIPGVIIYSFLFMLIIRYYIYCASDSVFASIFLFSILFYLPRIFLYDFVYLFKLITFFFFYYIVFCVVNLGLKKN
jgi:hypothetical protein